jgi:hypothetical protein
LLILQIEALLDSLFYTKSVVALLMPLLTIVQLFIDGLLSILVIATLLSFVAIVVISDMM